LDKSQLEKLLKPIGEILNRGNTVEIKKVKDGYIVLEVSRKIAKSA
jgi:hypothetical protein